MKKLKIEVTKYSCGKCYKEYSKKTACEEHEKLCKALPKYDTLITHDGLYTYPSNEDKSLFFARKTYLTWSRPKFAVYLEFDPQSTINSKLKRTFYESPFGSNLEEEITRYNASAEDLFSWSEDRENKIEVNIKALNRFSVEICYSDGYVKKLKKTDVVESNAFGEPSVSFKIFKNNPIIEIKVKDVVNPKIKTTVEYKLDLNISKYEVFNKEEAVLLKLVNSSISSPESMVRFFIKNTKLNMSKLPRYFKLEGNRVSHNTDDWLDTKGNVKHFQGSTYEGVRKGLFKYYGNTLEECILTREFFKLKGVRWSVGFGPRWDRLICFEFYIGETKFRFKGNTRYCDPKPYNYYKINGNDETEISALELYKLLLKFNETISVAVYKKAKPC
jgi:hypothetical protein